MVYASAEPPGVCNSLPGDQAIDEGEKHLGVDGLREIFVESLRQEMLRLCRGSPLGWRQGVLR